MLRVPQKINPDLKRLHLEKGQRKQNFWKTEV